MFSGEFKTQVGAQGRRSPVEQRRLVVLMMCMFFAFGFCTVLVDTLVPKFRAMFSLSYTEVMLTQFCYFGAYFVFSAPAGRLISAIGYLRTIVAGLLLMALGAFGFIPAALLGTYPGFLVALFVLAAGVTTVQVAANPATSLAGSPDGAAARLTLAQAFNSVATMVGPLIGAYLVLGQLSTPQAGLAPHALAAFRRTEAHVFVLPFAAIGLALLMLAAICWRVRGWSPSVAAQTGGSFRKLLGERRLMLGALSIFAYVGAEVSIGSSMTNYLMQTAILGVAAATAGRMVSLYWGGAMVGRFLGAIVLGRASGGLVLTVCATCAAALTLLSSASSGTLAAGTLLAVGLFNAVQFPTIFAVAVEGLAEDTPEASGIICLAIVGGAVVPLATGAVADWAGLSHALIVPALCYGWIATYGILVWTNTLPVPPGDSPPADGGVNDVF